VNRVPRAKTARPYDSVSQKTTLPKLQPEQHHAATAGSPASVYCSTIFGLGRQCLDVFVTATISRPYAPHSHGAVPARTGTHQGKSKSRCLANATMELSYMSGWGIRCWRHLFADASDSVAGLLTFALVLKWQSFVQEIRRCPRIG